MDRRNFFMAVAATGGAGLALHESHAVPEKPSVENASVAWTVSGFTCITCAVGLEALLKARKGIMAVKALYPSGRVEVGFDSDVIALSEIRALVNELGFRIESV